MPMWRCPHCGTLQPEAARCWVCQRSAVCCATCRHYRRSVAARIGYCGIDPRRDPLDAGERRPCWEGAPTVPADESAVDPAVVAAIDRSLPKRTGVRSPSGFVSLDELETTALAEAITAGSPEAPLAVAVLDRPAEPGWTLFPDLEA
jgi:hypothetical protein